MTRYKPKSFVDPAFDKKLPVQQSTGYRSLKDVIAERINLAEREGVVLSHRHYLAVPNEGFTGKPLGIRDYGVNHDDA